MEERFFTLSEVTKYLKIPKSTIYKLSQKGKIPSSKIGKQLRFRKSSLDKWLTEKEGGLKVQAQESLLIPDSAKTVEQNPKQVLLIDDDELVLKTLANFLKIYGYNVELAKDGEEALKKAEELTFDLIIADVRMPGIDGIETIKRIRETLQRKNRPAVPEIIITGYMDTSAQQEAEKLGISDYVYKPFIISELLKTVKKKISLLTLFFCLIWRLAFAADTTAPTGTIKINSDAVYTNATSAVLTLSAVDSGSGMGQGSQMRFSNDNLNWSNPEPFVLTKSWTLTSGNGTRFVYVKLKDLAGNWSGPISDSIVLDTTLPTGSIKINNGTSSTNTTSVTLNLSAADTGSGVSEMKFSNNNSTWTTPESYATTKSWTLTSGSGTKTAYVKFKDASGNWSNTYSDTIVLDTTPPTGKISINNNAAKTNSTHVTLTLSASDSSGISQMQFSDANLIWLTPEAYATTKSWTLLSGDGTKTVYVKFQDKAGNWSAAYLDTIVLDITAPIISNVRAANIQATSAQINWDTHEPATAQVEYGLTTSYGYKSSLSSSLVTTRSITISSLKQYTLYHYRVISKDNVANQAISGDYTFTTKDTTLPTGSVKINNGVTSTNTTSVTLNLSATDTGSGVVQMQFSNDQKTWTTAEPYATTRTWTLTTGSGTKTVYVKFKDNAGNWSNTYSDTIVLDTTLPTGSIKINNGATSTNSINVTLNLSASDNSSGVSQAQFSNNNSTWSLPETYSTSKSWALSPGDGTKTVYVQFKDGAGNWSIAYSDSIILDTTPPVISNVRATNIQTTSAQINWDTDEPSTSQVEYGLTTSYGYKTSLSSSLVNTHSMSLSSLKEYTLYHYRVLSKDSLGNQAVSGDYIFTTKDGTAPTGSIKINNGATSTNTTSVTLNLSATDTGSGVAQMQFSNDQKTWLTAESYSTTKSWILTSGNGTKTVYARFQDNTGNWSAICSDTITLTLPVIPQVSVNSVTSPTNQNSQVISGKKSADATEIIITSATATVERVNIAADNTWNCTLSNLKEAENIILAKARSATGTESAVVTLSIVLDTQGPAITIISPKENEIIYE